MSTDTGTSTVLQTGTYNIDPAHSRVGFVARHAMVTKVRGSFNEFAGSGYLDVENPEASRLELTIQANSIDTRHADRDAHLRSNDFFDMDNYPEIRFVSTSVRKIDDADYSVTGDLTIKDVTRPITVDFEVSGPVRDPWGNDRIGLEGSTVVSRKDWGVNFNVALEAGGVLVSDKVTLEFEVSAVKATDAAA
jgi:polyisoprenoid-binding protein YceI